jgi:uncharacterized membrane protein (UPF0182 family)
MPPDNLPNGPSIVAAQMQSDSEVSSLQTLLCQKGSTCKLRNLVVIPIDQSLLYVRSLFVQAETTQIPELRKVVVSYQDRTNTPKVAVDDTLKGALEKLFGSAPSTQEEAPVTGGNGTTTPSQPNTPTPGITDTENQLITGIITNFDQADAAARTGDQVAYAQKIDQARKLSQQLATLRRNAPTTTTPSGPGTGVGTPGTTAPSGGVPGGPTTTTPPSTTTTTTQPKAPPTTTTPA